MSPGAFDSIEACVFDAYGTLFDVHSAAARLRGRLGEQADSVSSLWRDKQLQYTWLRSLMERHADFWQVTGDALDYALEAHGIADDALRADLMAAYRALDAYPEVPEVLEQIMTAGLKTAILSNGAPAMLASAVESSGLGAGLDAVLSVEELGIYKPSPRVYQLAVDRLGVPPERISFQSSNPWDAAGAKSFGFAVAWIDRFGGRLERLALAPDARLDDLAGLPPLLGL